MKIRLGLISWATGAVALAAMSACGGNEPQADPPNPSTPARSTSTATPSRTSPTSPSDAAAAQASGLVRRYFAVLDELGQNRTSNLKALASVAAGTELGAEQSFFRNQHRRGERQVGDTRIAVVKVQSVNLDRPDSAKDTVPTIVMDVCWDVSKVDVFDRNGRSIVGSNRADTGWTRYTVMNFRFAADPSGGWRVASGQDLKQAPCAAS
jgi:hypothetical protein